MWVFFCLIKILFECFDAGIIFFKIFINKSYGKKI